MRYLVAMIFAAATAALAMLYLSGPLASRIVAQLSFDNPDQVGDLHTALFMGSNLFALLLGWALGWAIGGRLVGADDQA